MRRLPRTLLSILLPAILGGCSTAQSALHPLGLEAEQVARLFWVLTIFLGLVFVVVMILSALAIAGGPRLRAWLSSERVILVGGLAIPVISVIALMAYGLLVMASRASAEGDPNAVRATVIGEQWWWRVIYTMPDGSRFETANELHVPVGQPVVLELLTADVIHSFWVPSLAGKLDMIPGRTNRLTITATEPGISRGQCAEYCGGAHALMSFHVVAETPAAFQAWLDHEAGPAVPPEDADLAAGARLFAELGCGGCHAVRGGGAAGVIGPDLTHVGGRLSLAAATLPNDQEAFMRWIRNNQHVKPENRMPEYGILTDEELAQLARYLESLK